MVLEEMFTEVEKILLNKRVEMFLDGMINYNKLMNIIDTYYDESYLIIINEDYEEIKVDREKIIEIEANHMREYVIIKTDYLTIYIDII